MRAFMKGAFLSCALTLVCSSTALRAATIFSENFDELSVAESATTVGPFSAINGTNVDILGPGNGFGALCAGPESGNCVDMGGSFGNAAGQLALTTPLNLAAGVYDLSFDLVGSQRG